MHNDPVLSMLGIAAKSGNVVSGEFSTEKAVKTGQILVDIVTTTQLDFDMSEITEKLRNLQLDGHAIVTEVRKHLDAASEKNSVHHLP